MRQRNIKNLQEKLEQSSDFLVREPKLARGHWAEIFGNNNPIALELGCGKGRFITELAKANPNVNYVACEGQSNVALRALEKSKELQLTNLRIFIDYVKDLGDYFEAGELSIIYLNFSDPWPKARHAKRRLTYRDRLKNYKTLLGPDGSIEMKTDNEELFAFTLEEIEACGLEILDMTRDLHGQGCNLAARLITTEYEERFRERGKNINFVRVK